MGGIIASVEAGSIAEEIGLESGDEVLAIDGKPLQDLVDFRYLSAEERLELRIGNAGAVLVTVNGQSLGTLGAVGEVIDRVFEKVDEGVAEATFTATPSGTITVTATTAPTLTPTPTLSATPAITATTAATEATATLAAGLSWHLSRAGLYRHLLDPGFRRRRAPVPGRAGGRHLPLLVRRGAPGVTHWQRRSGAGHRQRRVAGHPGGRG